MTLGSLIKEEIRRQNRTQKDIALEMGISTTALSQIITDTYFPKKENLDKLCKILKVKLVFSFEKEKENE